MTDISQIQIKSIASKVEHYLITTMGRVPQEATNEEFYRALIYSIREEIMIYWLATYQTYYKNDPRMLYYLSMEYLPGRFTKSTLTNIQTLDFVIHTIKQMGRNPPEIFACEPDPGLGHGGLGRLASCFLDSLATHHYPVQAYGLRYQYGIFEQQIWNGSQIEAPDCWLINSNPWEFRRDSRKAMIKFGGKTISRINSNDEEIFELHDFQSVSALAFDLPIAGYNDNSFYSVVSLRLWTTKESPRNFVLQRYNAGKLDQAAENTMLTDVLYPSDHHETGKRIRLKQEFLLVSASLQDILRRYKSHHNDLSNFHDKVRIQINDTHPSLVIPELIRLLQKEGIHWKQALETVIECAGYTNHTILQESLEVWESSYFEELLPRQFQIIQKLDNEFRRELSKQYPENSHTIENLAIIQQNHVKMANLSIVGSHAINGVSALHTDILKSIMFRDFHALYPNKIVNITNGITQRRWLMLCNPLLSDLINRLIGKKWITDFSEIKRLSEFASDKKVQEEFLEIKKKNKEKLSTYLKQRNLIRNEKGIQINQHDDLNINALFSIQIKRIHEYKRQLLNILHLIMRYQEIQKNPQNVCIARCALFGGKSAAGYEAAKNIILLINCVARKVNQDPLSKGKLQIVFIENYNVSKAEVIIPACDLSEQISTAGTEASGTGNMKLAINGALTIGTDDGANIEMREAITDEWWPFTFGSSSKAIAELKNSGTYHPKKILEESPKISSAVYSLIDRTFAETDEEHQAFCSLHHQLIESHYNGPPDRYFVLQDLMSYAETQQRAEHLYQNPNKWAEYALHNIAGMGPFSSDRSIQNYAEKIWGLTPCPPDPDLTKKIQDEYRRYNTLKINPT